MHAAKFGHLSVLLLLLEHSANLDLQDYDGGTALMAAAYEGKTAIALELVKARANVNHRNKVRVR